MDGLSVAVVENGVTYYIRTDHIGRPVFATDSTGAKVWEASYLPFGEVLATTGTPIALRFPGQWFQAESGLHQNWMRDYDPTTGRYMQADPLGLVDGASVYGYARQNPGRYVDPTGEFIPFGAIAAGAAFGAGMALLEELAMNEWKLQCVDWTTVGLGGAVGAFGGAYASGISKGLGGLHRLTRGGATRKFRNAYGIRGRDTEIHHGLVRADGVNGPSWRHGFMNMRPMWRTSHRRIHGRWGGQKRFNSAFGDFIGAPAWAQVGGGLIGAGALADALGEDNTCMCAN